MAQPISTPIWQLRALQNWGHQVLISEICEQDISVAQIGCASGLDLGKWQRLGISKYLGIEKTSFDAQQAEARYDSKKPNFPASFVTLASLYNDASNFEHKYDVVASFDFLDGILFESNQSLTNMLKLVSSLLRPGGFFFGMLVDGSELWTRALKSNKTAFATNKNLAQVKFATVSSLFTAASDGVDHQYVGLSYEMKLDGDFEQYFLVHFPTLLAEASAVGLEMQEISNFNEFIEDHKKNYGDQLKRMGVLPPTKPNHPKAKILPEQREIAGLFATFVFQKQRNPAH